MNSSNKRKSENGNDSVPNKKSKKQWIVPRKGGQKFSSTTASIEPGDAGIWATCEMHKEGKCTAELKDLFDEYATAIYGGSANEDDAHKEQTQVDIETEIGKEVEGMKVARKDVLVAPVRIDMQCVLFFKTRLPIEPVSFVHRICLDAFNSVGSKKTRFVKRFTPMTRMGKATEKGIDEVSRAVLAPVFHLEGAPSKKFAIRTTIRNHHQMKRDDIIKQVATIVGDRHSVDLKNYDLLILVDVYRSTCGMSVVGNDYEKLKRFNLAEIHHPTPKAEE